MTAKCKPYIDANNEIYVCKALAKIYSFLLMCYHVGDVILVIMQHPASFIVMLDMLVITFFHVIL